MWIVGHRGAGSCAPENTLRAIRTGLDCADYAEVDVRMSHDSVPVVIHDARLDRTTSGTGQVNDLTFKELKELDAGEGEKIPSLEEVIAIATELGRGLVIEIKEPGSEGSICTITRNCDPAKVIFVSFHAGSMELLKSWLPAFKTGLILPNNQGHYQIDENWFGFDLLLPGIGSLCPGLVTGAHDAGTLVIPWIVNTRGELEKSIRIGADGIITDNPCNVLHLISTLRL